jgi:probable HAF family extracellular repeat protein
MLLTAERRPAAAALVLATASGTALAQGTFQPLGTLEAGGYSAAAAISADGQTVVGDSTFNSYWHRAFRWTAGSGMVNIDPDCPQYNSSYALGVSATGGIVTGYRIDNDYDSIAFRWTGESGLSLLPDVPGGIGGRAGGVSEDGAITAGEGAETFSNGGGRPARWTAAGEVSQLPMFDDSFNGEALNVSPDGSTIVGFCSHGDLEANPFYWEVEACRWVDGAISGLGRLPGAEAQIARATHASTDGSVICGFGYDDNADPIMMHGFRWNAANGIVLLPDLPASDQNMARSISDNGSTIVGEYHTGDHYTGTWHAAVWIDGQPADLADTLTNTFGVDLQGWALDSATGISADGMSIAGTGHPADGHAQAWVVHLGSPIWTPPVSCYANCDNSQATPRLNFQDFSCFLQRFVAGDSYANCDHSVAPPVLNVQDFSCFLQKFAAGCP